MHKPAPDISYVHTDLSSFRSVVQKLTGADPHAGRKLLTVGEKPAFKLQDRRKSTKKLRLNLVNKAADLSPTRHLLIRQRDCFVSPVSTLEAWPTSQSPPQSSSQNLRAYEEESGFSRPLELLPLFPVVSPRDEKNGIDEG